MKFGTLNFTTRNVEIRLVNETITNYYSTLVHTRVQICLLILNTNLKVYKSAFGYRCNAKTLRAFRIS